MSRPDVSEQIPANRIKFGVLFFEQYLLILGRIARCCLLIKCRIEIKHKRTYLDNIYV